MVTYTLKLTKRQLRKRIVKQMIDSLLHAGMAVKIIHPRRGRR